MATSSSSSPSSSSSSSSSTTKIKIPYVKRYKMFIFWATIILAFTEIHQFGPRYLIESWILPNFFFDTNIMAQSSLKKYLRSLRWTPLPVGVGLALICLQQFRHTRKQEAAREGTLDPCDALADEWEVEAYKLLPLRHFSRAWGWVNGLELPEWSRKSVLGLYVRTFGCNMEEAEVEDLGKYKCLSELFRRPLKAGVRPVDPCAPVVSPSDGTILSSGTVSCGLLEQIKGVSYPLRKFLGPNCWSHGGPMVVERDDDDCFHRGCLTDSANNQLYHCIIYLAPGDYHRFHSSADWHVSFRRHFPGELLSVNPSMAAWIRHLFVLNERVSYVGQWKHGFFSMTAVGATNVGCVKVYFDDQLKTNEKKWNSNMFLDNYFDKSVELSRGGEFGEFNLGSTIVLVFEAPKGTSVCVDVGQKVKMGQALFRIPKSYVGKARAETTHPGILR